MTRQLERPPPTEEDNDSKPILVVSCYGADEKLVKTMKENEDEILKTNSFKDVSKPAVQYVKKTGANIGSKLSVLRSIALGKKNGKTMPCTHHSNFMCCKLLGNEIVNEVNGLPVPCAPGNCKTKKVIYLPAQGGKMCGAAGPPSPGRTSKSPGSKT